MVFSSASRSAAANHVTEVSTDTESQHQPLPSAFLSRDPGGREPELLEEREDGARALSHAPLQRNHYSVSDDTNHYSVSDDTNQQRGAAGMVCRYCGTSFLRFEWFEKHTQACRASCSRPPSE